MKQVRFITLAIVSVLILSGCSLFGGAGSTSADTSSLPEPTSEISEADTTAEIIPDTTPEATTFEETTAEETTEEATAAEETTAEETTAEETTVEETVPEPVLLYLTAPIEGAEIIGSSANGYAIEVKDDVIYIGGVLMANKTYALPSSYHPAKYAGTDWTVALLDEAEEAFTVMQKAYKDENPDAKGFKIQSGFRSYTYQDGLYSNYVSKYGKAYTDTFSARPGHSEHQTGLGADINQVGDYTLTEAFQNTPEGKWLAENSWRFGFILRYPKTGEDKTGYGFEPWHFRYIGADAAKLVYDSGLTLEEYLGITSVYAD